MSSHRHQHSSRSVPYPTTHHHHPHVHSREREASTFEEGPKEVHNRRRNSRQPVPDESKFVMLLSLKLYNRLKKLILFVFHHLSCLICSFLPSNDRNEWYYPAARHSAEVTDDVADEDRNEESLLASRSGQGNWGHKLVKGSRWMRRGKIVAWGPAKSDWDVRPMIFSLTDLYRICVLIASHPFFRWMRRRGSASGE